MPNLTHPNTVVSNTLTQYSTACQHISISASLGYKYQWDITKVGELWLIRPWTRERLWGSSVSHKHTFLLSAECPAVAIRLDEPTNTKSLVTFEWHLKLCVFTHTLSLSFISPNWQPNTENTENKQTVRHNKNQNKLNRVVQDTRPVWVINTCMVVT